MISSKKNDKGRVVFLRLDQEMYEQLAALKEQAAARGIATIVKMIVGTALAEGITVSQEPCGPKETGAR